MATVAKSIGEFSGEDKETHQEWIEAAEVIGELAGVEENELLKMVILGLRGPAKTWGTNSIKDKRLSNFQRFKEEFIVRFTNHKDTDEVLSRFLSTPEVKSYETLMQLLKDARIVKTAKGVSVEHLMRQVIARAPSGIKLLL